MAEIDFHILAEDSDSARLKTTCSLIEKAWLAGERVLVWLDDEAAAAAFDNLLWTFGDRSFVPHEPLGALPAQSEAPVQISAAATLPPAALQGHFSLLVCLREQASPIALQFAKVMEVIDANPARRDAGRARFRFYREQGATPRHHELTGRN
jgi:DNA polymerase-3 subunit chi